MIFIYTVRKGQGKTKKTLSSSGKQFLSSWEVSFLFIYYKNIHTKKWTMIVGPDHKKILGKNQPSKQQQKENG